MSAPVMNAPALTEMAPVAAASGHHRDVWPAVINGVRGHCPACGKGKMFRAYLKVNDNCPNCGEELHHHRADDFPPYLTIVVAGHLVGTLLLLTEEFWPDAPLWLHAFSWPTLILILSLWLLPIIKGAVVAYQWALRMHGFATTLRSTNPIGPSYSK
jgi:uncharacterized protein (DUF983 family)